MFTNNLNHVKINLIFFNFIECKSKKIVNIKLKHVTKTAHIIKTDL